MERKFVDYVMVISATLGLTLFLILGFYTHFLAAGGILVGTGWGCINLYFLKKTLKEWLKLAAKNHLKFYAIISIKFPLLYVLGYAILKGRFFPPLHLLVGFSLIFVAFFLMAIVMAYLSKGARKVKSAIPEVK